MYAVLTVVNLFCVTAYGEFVRRVHLSVFSHIGAWNFGGDGCVD